MITHHHTRSDNCQTYSPRIPRPERIDKPLKCGPAVESHVRRLLTWNAGDCGLVSDFARDSLARMYFDGTLTLAELRKLASEQVYKNMVLHIDEIINPEVEE